MILSADRLAELISAGNDGRLNNGEGLSVIPEPDLNSLKGAGEASVPLRLGRWFLTLRETKKPFLDTTAFDSSDEAVFTRRTFVQFGGEYVLHPNRFALGSTLEWIKLPNSFASYVTGKSSLGRRGVVIETAAGIHPGFRGCLTLEITNLGEVPVILRPGMQICQIFIHSIENPAEKSNSNLAGNRRPVLGRISEDRVLSSLRKYSEKH